MIDSSTTSPDGGPVTTSPVEYVTLDLLTDGLGSPGSYNAYYPPVEPCSNCSFTQEHPVPLPFGAAGTCQGYRWRFPRGTGITLYLRGSYNQYLPPPSVLPTGCNLSVQLDPDPAAFIDCDLYLDHDLRIPAIFWWYDQTDAGIARVLTEPIITDCGPGPGGGPTLCGTKVVDTSTDLNNCGHCGVVCAGACVSGKCRTTLCGSSYVDTDTDVANCGACGRACSGTCALGRCLVTLASAQNYPTGVAVDGGSVYWTNRGNFYPANGSVMRVSVSGGATTTLASNQAAPISIAVDATAVYWTNLGLNYNPEYWTPLYSELPGDSAIMKAPRAGGPAKVLGGLDIVPFHNSLVVDPTTAYANLWQVSLSGGQVTSYGGSLLPSSYANGRSGSSVFAVQQASGSGDTTIVKTGADGGAPVTLATWTPTTYQGSSQPDSYGVTSDGTSVYWTTFAGDVKKVSVSGGTVTTLATNQAYAYGIAVDSTSVYFARQDLGGSIVKLTPK